MRTDQIESALRTDPPNLPASMPALDLDGAGARVASSRVKPGTALTGGGAAFLLVGLAVLVMAVVSRGPAGQPTGGGGTAPSSSPSGSTGTPHSASAVAPPPSASPESSAMAESRAINVILDRSHSMRLDIADASHLLETARSATELELTSTPGPPPGRSILVTQSGGDPYEILIVWIGTICDESAELRIDSTARTITIIEGPRSSCDAMAVGRGTVLKFERSIDADDVVATLEGR